MCVNVAIVAVLASLALVFMADTYTTGTVLWWWVGGAVFGGTVIAYALQDYWNE